MDDLKHKCEFISQQVTHSISRYDATVTRMRTYELDCLHLDKLIASKELELIELKEKRISLKYATNGNMLGDHFMALEEVLAELKRNTMDLLNIRNEIKGRELEEVPDQIYLDQEKKQPQ